MDTCEFPNLNSVRIAARQRFPEKKFSCFRVRRETPPRSPAAIENTFDEHRIRRDDEGNGHAPLESDTLCNVGPQAGIELRFRLAYT